MIKDDTNLISEVESAISSAEPSDSDDAPTPNDVTAPAASSETAPVSETTASEPPTSSSETETLEQLTKRVEEIAALLEETNAISRERERIIDRLHQEKQELRSGELWQAAAPVFRDLVRLYDDLDLTTCKYETRSEMNGNEVVRDFQSFRDAVEDVLYRHGVERYNVSPGTPFNSKEHKALGVVVTEDADLDRAVARVVRSGFRTESRLLRILEAEVFRFSAPSPTAEETIKEKSAEVAD